jgi:hypothetical protein
MKHVGIFAGAVLLLTVAVPITASCQLIAIEAEIYTASHNIDGSPIDPFGFYLWGLDYADEWTEYDFQVDDAHDYSIHVLMRGDDGVTCTLQLILTAATSGDTQSCEVTFLGSGMI